MSDQSAEMINDMAAGKLGPTVGQDPAPSAAEFQQTRATPKTATETAQTEVSPTTEGDAQDAEPVTYEVDVNGEKRRLTPQQIAGTLTRYRSLNERNAKMKPILEMADQLMGQVKSNGREADPAQLARFLQTAAQEYAKTARGKGNSPNANANDANNPAAQMDDELTRWEKENAVALPPGYKDAAGRLGGLENQMRQLMQAVQQMAAAGQAPAQAAAQLQGAADQTMQSAAQQTIANNMARIQQQYGLPDEEEGQFVEWMHDRGYTMEDMIDPQLALKVGGDYAAVRQGPEMDRIKKILQRRQAYTGAAEGAPGGASAPKPTEGQQFFDQLVGNAMSQRGIQ